MRKPNSLASPDLARPSFWLALWIAGCAFASVTCPQMMLPLVVAAAARTLSDDELRATANRIREALALARIPISHAAGYMFCEGESAESWLRATKRAPDLEKALNGERALNLWTLERLPVEFKRWYHLLELRDRGLPDVAATAIKIVPALLDVKRSA